MENRRTKASLQDLRKRRSRIIGGTDALLGYVWFALILGGIAALVFFWGKPSNPRLLELYEMVALLSPFWWLLVVYTGLRVAYHSLVIKAARLEDHQTGKTL